MADDWRLCVEWLVRCQILPEDHKATRSDANAFDLAQALRDGSLICHLLNQLYPSSVDLKEFSPRPQMSQFLCMKNIRTFLQTCKKPFGLHDMQLFQPQDLFDVKDFRKVLETMSVLSKTDIARRKTSGFPPDSQAQSNHYTDDPDNIYGELPDMAVENDLEDTEELYDCVYQDEEDKIYDDLCGLQREEPQKSQPVPLTKRDHCIKEMLDTEKNYVDALTMVNQHFIKPLHAFIATQDREVVFAHIEELLIVHRSFSADLLRAVETGNPTISSVFVNYKKKLLIYGDFCSNLPAAQEMIDKVCENDVIRNKIMECERKANEGKFRLRDLLHVPMQRVLKYHLLLRELIKNTDKSNPERIDLEKGLEAMQDLSLYVNEVKRDHEALQLIDEIQNSIVDLRMHLAKLAGQRPTEPANTSLKDYGRFQKDGELKVLSHMDSRVRNRGAAEKRHIFLFDKVMLMCKARGETYSFKDAIVLGEYKVDDSSVPNDKRTDKWNCPFIMVQKSQKMAFTFFAKTEDARQKWIEAIQMALENTQPSAGPNYVMQTFEKPRECDVCGKLLRGVFFQGYICQDTKKAVHKECIGKKPDIKPLSPRPPRPSPQGVTKARTTTAYTGTPPPNGHRALTFKTGETIDVVDQSDKTWWKGRHQGQEGFFPASYVQVSRIARKDSYLDVTFPNRSSNPQLSDTPSSPPSGNSTHSYVNVTELKEKPWYVDEMDRDAAQAMLDQCPDGTFLIRKSISRIRLGAYSLSIKYANAVRHIKVNQNAESKFFLAEGRYFDSVPRLVSHYQQNSLRDSFPDVNTTLRIPIRNVNNEGGGTPSACRVSNPRILGYAIAVYDYAATSTTQVSLKSNDRIAVISKNGSDKGWWKGQNLRSLKIGYFPLAYVADDDE
ncbi:guanine nucleotide exchange factor VAV2-like isoform X3 [Haliotis rufescens]|uniref:guanine nucleotide exchange factor VAV2-like isoform X3 n=1 Tax=Haliotis rufescens TaxID=6454 RepID=UPI001EB07789|nr:guanine nucleotide exchange factor VAV2-like isoform X3 [Haliotis rufescens]